MTAGLVVLGLVFSVGQERDGKSVTTRGGFQRVFCVPEVFGHYNTDFMSRV